MNKMITIVGLLSIISTANAFAEDSKVRDLDLAFRQGMRAEKLKGWKSNLPIDLKGQFDDGAPCKFKGMMYVEHTYGGPGGGLHPFAGLIEVGKFDVPANSDGSLKSFAAHPWISTVVSYLSGGGRGLWGPMADSKSGTYYYGTKAIRLVFSASNDNPIYAEFSDFNEKGGTARCTFSSAMSKAPAVQTNPAAINQDTKVKNVRTEVRAENSVGKLSYADAAK